jgi:integrase
MSGQAPANWYPAPFGCHELRYWDGGQWTQHVASRGRQEIDPPVSPMLKEHMGNNITGGREGLLFPATNGGTLSPSTLYKVFYTARTSIGRPDLRWHDLRHTGAVLAAQTGATLAELMGRLGHSTPGAALGYQHAAEGRDKQIAQLLSAMATAETRSREAEARVP